MSGMKKILSNRRPTHEREFMPIKLPADLPAYTVLKNEGVMVMSDDRAARQDIRPLRIVLLNLMPKKIQTENQCYSLILYIYPAEQ